MSDIGISQSCKIANACSVARWLNFCFDGTLIFFHSGAINVAKSWICVRIKGKCMLWMHYSQRVIKTKCQFKGHSSTNWCKATKHIPLYNKLISNFPNETSRCTAVDPVMSLVGQCIRVCSLCTWNKMTPTLKCCTDCFSCWNREGL
jgi:hypothetical protein